MTTAATQPLSERLPGFFRAYAETRSAPEKQRLSKWLPGFFYGFSAYRVQVEAPKTARVAIDPDGLAAFLASLKIPLIASRQGAFHFDPWEIAGLESKETRNASVLAWLLNPLGSHGLGVAAINGLLAVVNRHFQSFFNADFSAEPGQFCRVRTEINPNGEIADRVDVEIDAKNFYLIVEIKINAPEQSEQLERYCRQAEERAGNRPWAVVFLTPKGKEATSAGKYADSGRIVPMLWKSLASALEQQLPNRKAVTHDLPLLSIPRQSAEYAVRCFLKKIRSF
ncbi:MAG: PD-(D/E)XK nuclease family protein [Immundisolibacter sp.]|uniref:PDDEXK-like family protein n=1 Tax=Immundisolibacter sp. TaxID=1934948 RepID=UPI0019B83DE6|nr:PD-(D/E)XK nuclease family protein [Immundisolibacter sp.]MBC7163157.1 PD-(D/E)XK nuclease family protein [Immundisolibacter sp.]